MADAVKKFLAKTSLKDRAMLIAIINDILSGKMSRYDTKKLAGNEDIFRIRKGGFRIIYKIKESDVVIIDVTRRNEKTYKDF